MSSIDMHHDQSRVNTPLPFDSMPPSAMPSLDFSSVALSPRLLSLKPPTRSSSAGRVTDQPTHHYQQEWRRRQSSDGQVSQFALPTDFEFATYMADPLNNLGVLSSIPSSTFQPCWNDAFSRTPGFVQN